MPKAQFDHHATIAASVPEVWEQMQRPETWAGLGPIERIWDPKWEEGILCSFQWHAQAGPRKVDGVATTRQVLTDELMVIDLQGGGFNGLLTTELSANGDGTDAHVVLALATDDILLSLVFGVVADVIKRGLPEQVEQLAARVEAEVG